MKVQNSRNKSEINKKFKNWQGKLKKMLIYEGMRFRQLK